MWLAELDEPGHGSDQQTGCEQSSQPAGNR
jgi:hypothetical protein